MTELLVIGLGFLAGALPFSVWIGRLALGKDIRQYGDGNPGATNVFRAGGKRVGALAAVLDGFKGLLPVSIAAYGLGISGAALAAAALAPILGHAFSPFLRGRGGKAVAVTFGVWTALTLYEAPIVLGLMLFYWYKQITVSGWALMAAFVSLGVYLLLARRDPVLLAVLAGNMLIAVLKHRADLAQPLGLRRFQADLP